MGTFAGTASFALVGSYTKASDLTTLTEAVNYSNSPVSYTSGTGNFQADLMYTDTRTLNGTDTFDLDAGSLLDSFGAALVFARIRLLFIRSRSTTDGQIITLSGDFTTQAGVGFAAAGLKVGPGGDFLMNNPRNGYTVTATTGDVFTVATTASWEYDIIILGTSV